MAPEHPSHRDYDPLNDGWTIVGPSDRAMDVHLQLLIDEATEALSRVKDVERVRAAIARVPQRRRVLPRD